MHLNTASCFLLRPITVFENLLDREIIREIDRQCALSGGLSHVLFDVSQPRSLAEWAISSILVQLNDSELLAEYWWREEWLSLDLHRDVDEELAIQRNIFRYPKNAHVLYLSVGESVSGPTIVIQENHFNLSSSLEWHPQLQNITIVPAVEGRLLRFEGSLLHAVPRPALAYLDRKEGGCNLEIWTRRRPNPNDPADQERTVFRRSVLLFNTWRRGEGPLSVPSELPLPLPLPPPAPLPLPLPLAEAHSLGSVRLCNSFEQWTKVDITIEEEEKAKEVEKEGKEGDARVHLRIGLLGNRARRGRYDRAVEGWMAPRAIKAALQSIGGMPTSFRLSQRD